MNFGTEFRELDVDETLTFKLRGMLIYLMRNRQAADYGIVPQIRFYCLSINTDNIIYIFTQMNF